MSSSFGVAGPARRGELLISSWEETFFLFKTDLKALLKTEERFHAGCFKCKLPFSEDT